MNIFLDLNYSGTNLFNLYHCTTNLINLSLKCYNCLITANVKTDHLAV